LIFRSVHAARVHLRAAHNYSRRLFQAAGCLSHFRVMPCNRRSAGGLESETKKDGRKISGQNEKNAKVRKLPNANRRLPVGAMRWARSAGCQPAVSPTASRQRLSSSIRQVLTNHVSLQSAFWPAGTIACRFNLRLTRRNLGAPASRRPLVPKEQLKIAPRFNAGGEKTNKTSPERTAEKNQAKNVKNSNRSFGTWKTNSGQQSGVTCRWCRPRR